MQLSHCYRVIVIVGLRVCCLFWVFLSVLVKYVYLGSTSGIIISSTFVNCHVPKVLLCKPVLVAFLFIHILKMATVAATLYL